MNTGKSIAAFQKARSPFAPSKILAGMLLLLGSTAAYAHGIVGNRIFLSPIVGNDAFPDNAFDLTMRRCDHEFSLLPVLEKQFSDNSSLLFVGGWYRVTLGARQRRVAGFGDLTIYYRHALYISVPHQLEVTLSPFLVVPTGTRRIADQGYTHLGGEMLIGKGLGDLPNSAALKYLRLFALQAEAGYAGGIQGPANSDVFGNLELEYSVQYLDKFVMRLDVGRPFGRARAICSVQLCAVLHRVSSHHEARLSADARRRVPGRLLRG
jgi:hypothetical protein